MSQAFDGPASLLLRRRVWRERRYGGGSTHTSDSGVSPASMAAWLSSTGLFHHDLLPHIPSIRLSTVNSSPRSGIAPQSLNSSSQLLRLPGDLQPCLGCVWLWQGLSDSPSIQAVPDPLFHSSLKCVSSDSDSRPDVGIGSLLQSPHPPRSRRVQSC